MHNLHRIYSRFPGGRQNLFSSINSSPCQPPLTVSLLPTCLTHTMGSTQPEFKNPATTSLLELVKARRTHYNLKAESPISDDAIESIVRDTVLHVPSSFNTQTSRVVLLLKEEHKKVWDIALNALEGLVTAGVVPREQFETSTKPKLNAFRAAYGTVCLPTVTQTHGGCRWMDNWCFEIGSFLCRFRVSRSYQGEVRHLRRQIRSLGHRVERYVSVPRYVCRVWLLLSTKS